jgi:hypothetical protein
MGMMAAADGACTHGETAGLDARLAERAGRANGRRAKASV